MSWSIRLTGCLGLLAAALCAPAVAQYKVVQPDGSVTYTDRPPASTAARITPLRSGKSPADAPPSGLPNELRVVAQRYPVTLYTSTACTPCDSARSLLQQRGIPYAEKRVLNDEDILALERLVGGRTVPSLNIGAQPLRGFSETEWTEFLDAAGYPRESRLPRGWKLAEVTTLTERAQAPAAAGRTAAAPAIPTPAPAPAPAPTTPTAPSNPTPGNIRF